MRSHNKYVKVNSFFVELMLLKYVLTFRIELWWSFIKK